MKEHWYSNCLKLHYERLVEKAKNEGFTVEDINSPYLDKLLHQSSSARIRRMVQLAYTLGEMRGVQVADEGRCPITTSGSSEQDTNALAEDALTSTAIDYKRYSKSLCDTVMKNETPSERFRCEICDALADCASCISSLETQRVNLESDNLALTQELLKSMKNKEQTYTAEDNILSVEMLRSINRDMNNRRWVWIENMSSPDNEDSPSAYYRVSSDYSEGRSFCCGYPGYCTGFKYETYGKDWTAYNINPRPFERG